MLCRIGVSAALRQTSNLASGAKPTYAALMVARIHSVAFQGVEVLDVDVQVQLASGMPAFTIVGLPDKAVAESRERVRAALHAIGLSLPPKRIAINLAPADVLKEGSHFDLPIALGLLAAMQVIDTGDLDSFSALGELGLDGTLARVAGVLPAALRAAELGKGLICPQVSGPEAVWGGDLTVLAPRDLLSLINHFKGTQVLDRPQAAPPETLDRGPDLADVKGQDTAKRALEVAASGGHNMLMIGPPGSGKSMLAARLPGILPLLTPAEALETSMIHSVAGQLTDGRLLRRRPYRDPHHSASLAALVGGGLRARPGEISLAHRGVLFLDELPEFQRSALEALRQPLETGRVTVARANAHLTYPARFQLVAAMNPCRCGGDDESILLCRRRPKCTAEYQGKISGPVWDRIDLHIDVPAVSVADLAGGGSTGDSSAQVAERVAGAISIQAARYAATGGAVRTNAELDGALLEEHAAPDAEGQRLLLQAAERMGLSARGYHRVLKVARTLADMSGEPDVRRPHIAEALAYRRIKPDAQLKAG